MTHPDELEKPPDEPTTHDLDPAQTDPEEQTRKAREEVGDFKTPFDQTAKMLAEGALETVAHAKSETELVGPLLSIDVCVIPFSDDEAAWAEIGWLGRMCRQPCALEFYHHPPTAHQVHLCMTRRTLWGLRLRKADKQDAPTKPKPKSNKPHTNTKPDAATKPDAMGKGESDSGEPLLWIISAGEPEGALLEFGFEPDARWESGVYKLKEALGVYMVVVSGLPRLQDTLLLRLTGKGPTLQRAIEDLDALPHDHRLRALAAQIIGLFHLDKRRKRQANNMEDLYMQITDPVYVQFIQEQQHIGWLKGIHEGEAKGKAEGEAKGKAEGEAHGKTEGQRLALARYLTKRFGGDHAAWRAALEPIQHSDLLEALSDAIYDATTQEAALAAIAQAKG